jgi:LuxR family transcriptional regulator, quorum-sensing system regulator BjaR1
LNTDFTLLQQIRVVGIEAGEAMLDQKALEYVASIGAAKSSAQVRDQFSAIVSHAGYTAYGCTEMPGPAQSLDDCVLLNGWPADWAARYFERGYVRRDPVVHFMRGRTEPYTWEHVKKQTPPRSDLNVMLEASEFKMRQGFVVPIYGLESYTAMVTLSGESVDHDPKTRAALHLISIYTHQKLRDLRGRPVIKRLRLSKREAECLTWVAQGKSDWEIGEILCVSERTAHWHIENAKRKYNVPTRVQAVVGALKDSQIDP